MWGGGIILHKGVRDSSEKMTFDGDLGEVREQRPDFISTNIYGALGSGYDTTNQPHNCFLLISYYKTI